MIDTQVLRVNILNLATSGQLTVNMDTDRSVESIIANLPEPSNKRKKLLNQIFEYDKTFDIPSYWTWVKLGEITSYGDTPCKVMVSDCGDENWVLELEDIQAGGKLLRKKRAKERKSIGEKTSFKEGQLLYSKLRPYLKKVLIADEDGISTPELIASDVYAGILPQYLVYCLTNSYVDHVINKRSYGIKMPRVDVGFMVNLPIPLPPVEEQQRIVDIVQSAFKEIEQLEVLQAGYANNGTTLKKKLIDAGIQGKLTRQLPKDGTAEELFAEIQIEKQKLIKEKKIKKEKVLADISEEEIPFEIPSSWKWVRLGDICSKISSGNTPAGGSKGGAYVTEGYCFFREQNIYNDGIHNDGMVYITEELLNTRPNSTVLPKDILLNITGGSIGRCALIPDDFSRGSINQHILIIRVVDPRIRFYIHKCLCSPYYQKLIMGNVVGDKDGFSAGRCKNTLIPLPPIAEQIRIVDKIDELLSLI